MHCMVSAAALQVSVLCDNQPEQTYVVVSGYAVEEVVPLTVVVALVVDAGQHRVTQPLPEVTATLHLLTSKHA